MCVSLWVMKYLRGFDECDGDLVCLCVSMEGLQTSLRFSLMNTASVTRTMGTCCNLPAVCVCVWGGAAAAPLKPVTGVCETTADNNGPLLVQVRLNDRELKVGRFWNAIASHSGSVSTQPMSAPWMGACVWHRCVKVRAIVVLEWLQWRLGLWINLISSSAISYLQPGNLKPPHSSNIQLFTISCLPEICFSCKCKDYAAGVLYVELWGNDLCTFFP